MASRQMIGKISAFLGLALGHPIPPKSLPVWESVLGPIPDELAERATMEVVRKTTKAFAPAPGAIYQEALRILGGKEPLPGEAWSDMLAVLRGDKERVALSAVTQQAVEQVGGWMTLDEMRIGDTTTRAHFYQVYREALDKYVSQLIPALPTIPEDALQGGERENLHA